jgi:DNA mismatch endonuclease, patch repair protein
MAGIRSANTRPELAIRKAVHRRGLRYRLHAKNVSGRPDFVFPARKAAIFVHGCFWHGHDCRFFRLPGTRREFWKTKLLGNRVRDLKVRALLAEAGWRQLVIWECAIRGQRKDAAERIAVKIERWLNSRARSREIRGS